MAIRDKVESAIIKKYKEEGWKVLTKGWPDLLCFKTVNGEILDFKFVEIKSNHSEKLTPEQIFIKKVLEKAGCSYIIEIVGGNENEITTLLVSKRTRERLGQFGNFNESMDDLINRLLNEIEEKRGDKK
jgi:hypothetical protein